jgi:hypothetical protein
MTKEQERRRHAESITKAMDKLDRMKPFSKEWVELRIWLRWSMCIYYNENPA